MNKKFSPTNQFYPPKKKKKISLALTKFEAKLISKGWTETFHSIKFQIKIKIKLTEIECEALGLKHAAVEVEAVKIETKTQQHASKTLSLQHHRTRSASERDTNKSTAATQYFSVSLSDSFLLFSFISLWPLLVRLWCYNCGFYLIFLLPI